MVSNDNQGGGGRNEKRGGDRWRTIEVSTVDDLEHHEAEILERIEAVPNGGSRFLVHPFALLADVDVDLSPAVRAELEQRIPELSGLSRNPYRALVESDAEQPVRFHVKGLFPGEEEVQQ